jgi:hypothetical protein
LDPPPRTSKRRVDYLRDKRGVKVGSIHLNVFRPFPDAAVITALAGKKNVIVLERTDEPMGGRQPDGGAISGRHSPKRFRVSTGFRTSLLTRCRDCSAAFMAWGRGTSGRST